MSAFRFSPRHLVGGLILSAMLFGCDNPTTVEVPGASRQGEGADVSPQQTPVPIHRIYSGDPARGGDTINVADQWVYVEILSVQQYMGRPASPNDVRIGATWETGVPAQTFQLLDINNDGVMDIRLRFSRQALQNAGLLPIGQTTLVVWGRDQTTGQLYRGQRNVIVVGPPVGQPCTWDNGNLVTHPNGGTGAIAGQHVSMSDPVNNTAGSNILLSGAGPGFRIGDDFAVGVGGCVMNQVVTFAYRTGGPPNWTSANINIRSGSVEGPIVATATSTNWQFTEVYRTFNAVLNNADRPIYRIFFDFQNMTLAEGIYWIDWQIVGGTSAWAPYVTLPGSPPGANNTQTVFVNGQQMTALGVWQPTLAAPGAEIPFLVRGPGAPPLSGGGEPAAVRPPLMPADYNLWPADRAQ